MLNGTQFNGTQYNGKSTLGAIVLSFVLTVVVRLQSTNVVSQAELLRTHVISHTVNVVHNLTRQH